VPSPVVGKRVEVQKSEVGSQKSEKATQPPEGVLLGSVALVLGALGFAAAWVPALWLVGVVLAGLGFLLGACVLLWAMPHGAAASGFPAAGTAVSLQGLIVAGALLWLSRSPGPAQMGGDGETDDSRPVSSSSAAALRDVPPLLLRKDLGKALNGSEDRVRRETATVLGDISGQLNEAVPELTEALKHTEPSVRSAAAEALGRLGPTARGAYPALEYLSRRDPDRGVKQTALLACERMGKPGEGDVALLCQGLKDVRPSFRASVAQAMASIVPPAGRQPAPHQTLSEATRTRIRDALCEALANDDDARVRIYAAQTLWTLKRPAAEVLPVLIAALKDRDTNNRVEAANALAHMTVSARPALPALKAHLNYKEEPIVRFYAAYAVWVIQREQADVVVPTLVKLLDEKDTPLRAMTVEVLASIGPPAKAAVAPLVNLLKSGDPALVARAALALGAIGPDAHEAVKPMVEVLAVGRNDLQEHILFALGGIGPEARDAVPALRKLLLDSAPKIQGRTAHTLAQIGTRASAAIPELTAVLKTSRVPSTQMFAAQALWKIASRVEEALPVLLDILGRPGEDNAVYRAAAARTLGDIGPPALVAVAALTDARNDPHEKVKAAAVSALEAIGPPQTEEVDRLVEGLKSDHLTYRIECTRALAMVGRDRKDAIPELIKGLKHPEPRVRVLSVRALKAIVPGSEKDGKTKEAATALVGALKEASGEMRSAVIEALAALGPEAKDALAQLRVLLKEKNVKQQLLILGAMADMEKEAKDAVPELIALLKENDEKELRATAALALGNIGPNARAALDALRKRLKDPDSFVRVFAARALHMIDPALLMESVPVLASCLHVEEEPGIRAAAAQALGEVGADVLKVRRSVLDSLEQMRRSREPQLREAAEIALRSIDPKGRRR
jgi:HEAT repeat protein